MILVFAFAGGVNSGHVGGLIVVVHPDAAHGVVHTGENLHRLDAGIHADEFLVDFEDPFEFAVEHFFGNVREVEIDGLLAANSLLQLEDDFVDGARCDVARHEIAVLRIPLLEKIKSFGRGNRKWRARVGGIFRHPDASAFPARGFAHQPKFVLAGDRCRVNLNEFAVGVIHALLEKRGLRRAGADYGIRRAAEDGADSAGAENRSVGGKGADFHGFQIHCADAAADARFVQHRGQERPAFVFFYLAFGLEAAHLFVEGVENLLAGSGAGECGAIEERAAEAAIIEKALSRAIEHDAHAIEEIDQVGRVIAHRFYGGLVGEEIAAVNRVVKMDGGGVAFALGVFCGVDSTLRADGMRTLHGHDRK